MKKLLSLVLAMLMIVGTFAIGAVAADGNTAVKFDDAVFDEGGNVGMGTFAINSLLPSSGQLTDGYTVALDFIYGRSATCFHPTDATLKHSSKFAVLLGQSEGTYKYVGYSATYDYFFVATSPNFPTSGEGVDGFDYLATSETGLIKPGVTYRLAFEFVLDTGVNLYVDGVQVLSFDLYEDLDYPTYFAHSYFMMYPTHMTCYVDNAAAYAPGVYDPATGEGEDDYTYFSDFEDAEMGTSDVTDENGNVTGTVSVLNAENWQFANDSYSLVDPKTEIYGQPQYAAEEGKANIIFQSWLDKKENGADEIFRSGVDFKINVTMANNPGINSIEMDLLNDPCVTVKEVAAADGLTATLDGSKLTITGSNYTGEALATITYHMDYDSTEKKQGTQYGYGADVATLKVAGADGDIDAVLTNGVSVLYNYTEHDVNDDGKYNLADVMTLLKIIAKWDMTGVFKQAGDVNGDGRINTMDASYYLRWIAGWPGYTIGGVTRY